MSIFNKSITALATADLQELLTEQAAENIRLEFKTIAPPKDELSSFGNTYGGYVVIGATEDGKGRLTSLPGIAVINSFRQQIVQWCYDGVWAPLEVFVSDPIPSPQDATKVCYVIEVPLSAETPHFLNGRKGAYVRTDEFSQRFEPQLATWEELTHLGHRRATLVERREALTRRSIERFDAYAQTEHDKGKKARIGATLFVSVSPQFPQRQLVEHGALLTQFESHYITWRSQGFPVMNVPKISAHESLLMPGAAYRFSLVEITVWGHLFYAVEIEEDQDVMPGSTERVHGIHSGAIVGYLLVFIEHAAGVLKALGYDGPLLIRVQMVRIKGVPLLFFPYSAPTPAGSAPYDDTLSFEIAVSSRSLASERDNLVGEMVKTIYRALNWSTPTLGPDAVEQIIAKGKTYNFWK
jgi:hypothetical protein